MDNQNDVTRVEIAHDSANTNEATAGFSADTDNTKVANQQNEEEVPTSTKVKIIAALAIVGIAGYIAYWVQEPVNLKADLLDADSSVESSTPVDTSSEVAESTTEDTALVSGSSVNVDVSLYGFEPAVLKIDAGTTVIWTNTSTADQTIIGSSTDGQSFASSVMTPGDTFSYVFDQDADFEYYSTFNPALKATITVGLGSAVDSSVTTTDVLTTAAPETAVVETAASSLFGSAPTDVLAAAALATDTALANVPLTQVNTSTTTAVKSEVSAQEAYDLKAAAGEMIPSKLAKTGPTENLYCVILLTIAWFNRKKLAKVFQK
ncbi:hypothetical protein IT411_02905 [Candidatus Peregrinibacteria bacterium]|nr:hypothetical protein [Candidatus Peregrinibacteria bacterium]